MDAAQPAPRVGPLSGPSYADCPVCLSAFEERGWRRGKLLPCEHAFCSVCLNILLCVAGGASGQRGKAGVPGVCCPLCRRFTPIPGGIIALLPDYRPPAGDSEEDRGAERAAGAEESETGAEEQAVAEGTLAMRAATWAEQDGEPAPGDVAARRLLALFALLLLILLSLLPLQHSPLMLALVGVTAVLVVVAAVSVCHVHRCAEHSEKC
ncbi:E3 ubiquitin-protein ligase RNF186-like [Megalops cyprinoides]|uniref:E3 ubiquitin-protein ligase RNF186-like n=1 Tax=Megalops cyprinoides TaxID=118141 RepID=UPI00186567DD|nr:E3 ubiquitin-protein ligase RNF186-like [Megalops cyprinoides]